MFAWIKFVKSFSYQFISKGSVSYGILKGSPIIIITVIFTISVMTATRFMWFEMFQSTMYIN
jgi:hypothetical protein